MGLDLSAGWPLVANTWILAYRQAGEAPDATVNPGRPRLQNDCKTAIWMGSFAWTMDQPSTGHGVAVWFDRIVADGIKISNEPGAPEAVNVSDIYGQAFFPWPNPVDLEPGDQVSFRMKADLVKDDYVWRWETIIRAGTQEIKAHFRQSSLHGNPLSLEFSEEAGSRIRSRAQ